MAQEQPAANQQQIQLRVADQKDLKGTYSNLMMIAHTQEEFILDFFTISGTEGILASRVITSPGHIKRMIAALHENLKKYEDRFGEVKPAEQQGDIGFKA